MQGKADYNVASAPIEENTTLYILPFPRANAGQMKHTL